MASLEVGIVGCRTSARLRSSTRSPSRAPSHVVRGGEDLRERRRRGGAGRAHRAAAVVVRAGGARRSASRRLGLVRGAASDDGLGGEYLGHLRATDALAARRALLRRTRRSPTSTVASIRSPTPRRSTSSCCWPIRRSSSGAASASRRPRGSARSRRATSWSRSSGSSPTSTRARPRARSPATLPDGPRPADAQADDLRRERRRGGRRRVRSPR